MNSTSKSRLGHNLILLLIFIILLIYAYANAYFSPIQGGFGEKLWVYHTPSGFEFKEVSFGDVVGGDEKEVFVLTWNDELFVLDGVNGSLLWNYKFRYDANVTLGDVDGDGNDEVIVSSFSDSYNLSIIVFDGDGSRLWSFYESIISYDLYVSDVDGDGVPEIVLMFRTLEEDSIFITVFRSYNGEVLWASKIPKLGNEFDVIFGYINDDSYIDMIVYGINISMSASDSINFLSSTYVISGYDGSVIWNISVLEENITERYIRGWPFDFISRPVVSDLNGDNWGDIILTGLKGKVYVLDGRNGSFLWSTLEIFDLVKKVSVLYIGNDNGPNVFIESLLAVGVIDGHNGSIVWFFPSVVYGFNHVEWASTGDIDSNGVLDFLIGVYGKDCQEIFALYGNNGSIAWNAKFAYLNESNVHDNFFSEATLVDLNGDGSLEIAVVAAYSFYVLDTDGNMLWSYDFGGGFFVFMVLMDLDADGGLEAVIVFDRWIYVFGFLRG